MEVHKAIRIDRSRPLAGEPRTGHNRWHPDVPPVIRAAPGETVCLETRDALDGQVTPASRAEDLLDVDPGRTHPLTGPVHVEGAEPGDLLAVEVLEVTPADYGFGVETRDFGMLRQRLPGPFLAHFTLADGVATSPQLPGVRIPGTPFMGVMGVAPDHQYLDWVREYEAGLAATGLSPTRPQGAVPEAAADGLGTVPPRSNGGNLDIKQLTAGATLYLPVFVPGALFSAGDAHFAQGDAECVTGLEMQATLYCRFGLEKGAAGRRGITDPQLVRHDYHAPPEIAVPKAFFATTGQSYVADGSSPYERIDTAAANALSNMIDHLVAEHGYTQEQAYMICSLVVDLRLSQAVNRPNFTVTAVLPTHVFES